MRNAVIRADPDPLGKLSGTQLESGIDALRGRGFAFIGRRGERLMEFVTDSTDKHSVRERALDACVRAFGVEPLIEEVTFISRGTDEDALGIVAAFGVQADVERFDEAGEEVAVFTLPAGSRRQVPESRLHTALEAALNCEVRIRYA